MKKALLMILLLVSVLPTKAITNYTLSSGDCKVSLNNDTLVIENSKIKRIWLWNGGNLITCGLKDKSNNVFWITSNNQPDLTLPGEAATGSNATIHAEAVKASLQYTDHLRIHIEYQSGNLSILKIIKIYPDCPAIACELYLKGKASQTWIKKMSNAADLQNIERLTNQAESGKVPVMEQLSLPGKHWQIEAIEFLDITDRFNTLVRPVKALSYQDCVYRGNLLYAENTEKDAGVFMLKESPTSNVQLYYPNGDFLINKGSLQLIGLGIDSTDVKPDEWTKAYGYVTGVYKSGGAERQMALRNYQTRVRPSIPERDEMIMLNTWGDRGQDTRVNESFCLKELDLAAKLGITHFQIDDGWQAGRSANSAFGGSFENIWDNPNYWTPDPVRFPNGLDRIVQRGKELGIEISLWFNPSFQNDYADWEKDAQALITLYQKYGIHVFKIDGTAIPNKLSEIRLRNLYERVMAATEWKAVLNLDATAGRRGGYFFFNEYGNIFLENRYTDWGNYYPYWTLRNLWMLSNYLPPQSLQIEFLNKWRNQKNYTGDRFAPDKYSFDYLFAITLPAQPLAWLETANLPAEAYSTGEAIKKYKTIRNEFHSGYIFPIGEEPSGKSWCGFQSIKKNRGFILIFREDNKTNEYTLPTYLPKGKEVKFTRIMGDGKTFSSKTSESGRVTFSLSHPNSYVLYSYQIL